MCGSLSLYNFISPHTVGAIHIFVRRRRANTSVDAQLAKWRLPGRTIWRGPRNGAACEASRYKQLRRLPLKVACDLVAKYIYFLKILCIVRISTWKFTPRVFQHLIILMFELIMGTIFLIPKVEC